MDPVEVKQPKNLQDDDAEKTSECPDERRQVTEQIEDTAKVKITKEKGQPLDQTNRNSPDSMSLRNSSWAYQSLVVAQRQVPTVQDVLSSAVEASADGAGSARAAQRHVR